MKYCSSNTGILFYVKKASKHDGKFREHPACDIAYYRQACEDTVHTSLWKRPKVHRIVWIKQTLGHALTNLTQSVKSHHLRFITNESSCNAKHDGDRSCSWRGEPRDGQSESFRGNDLDLKLNKGTYCRLQFAWISFV